MHFSRQHINHFSADILLNNNSNRLEIKHSKLDHKIPGRKII